MDSDELSLQGAMPVRHESPTLETEARKAIEVAIRDLIENKSLYQKVEVDLGGLKAALIALEEKFVADFDSEKKKRGMSGIQLAASEKKAKAEWQDHIHAAMNEVAQRPWDLVTRHQGDDPTTASIMSHARAGTQPLGTPNVDRNLAFYLPSVQLYCGHCKAITSFSAHVGSSQGGFGHPFQKSKKGKKEQIFVAFYRCERCKDRISTVLIQRKDLKLHLCGFAPRKEQQPGRAVPAHLAPILLDADNAVAEGDVFAGFYHLRTLVEHYLKSRQGIGVEVQIRGEELLEKHYSSLPEHLRSILPSLTNAFTELSGDLHARKGNTEDYLRLRTVVFDHIDGVALLEKYGTASQ